MSGNEDKAPHGADGSEYDHDALTFDQLSDLLGGCPDGPHQSRVGSASFAVSVTGPASYPSSDGLAQSPQPPAEQANPKKSGTELDDESVDAWHSPSEPEDLPTHRERVTQQDLLDMLEAELTSPAEAPAISFDVPDVVSADAPESEEDLEPEVDSDRRARQLAFKFLHEIGELKRLHVEWVSEIVLARRWSTAQLKVRELLECGYGLGIIYRSFLVSEAWRECDVLDERIGERTSGGWMHSPSPRLSWLEAVRLVSYFEDDSTIDEIIQFAESERHAWRANALFLRLYPRFKSYLLEYRISEESRRPALGWYRTLAPHDSRDFAGQANPEYTPEWWEDEVPSSASRVVLMQRIFRGDPLGMLVPHSPDDDFGWVEEME